VLLKFCSFCSLPSRVQTLASHAASPTTVSPRPPTITIYNVHFDTPQGSKEAYTFRDTTVRWTRRVRVLTASRIHKEGRTSWRQQRLRILILVKKICHHDSFLCLHHQLAWTTPWHTSVISASYIVLYFPSFTCPIVAGIVADFFSQNLQRLQMRIQSTYPANFSKISNVVQ